ncbi:MAG: hypothetical protein J7M25_05120 [Deltaproteobacteria bacterium]|nr:hypothetical protein [Deltaproteobacteria bacterium]
MISYEKLSAALERYRRGQRGEAVDDLPEAPLPEEAIAFDVDDSAIIEAADVSEASAAQPPAWPDEPPAVPGASVEDSTWQTSETKAPPAGIDQDAQYGEEAFADEIADQQSTDTFAEEPMEADQAMNGPTGEYAEGPMDQAYAEQPSDQPYAEQPVPDAPVDEVAYAEAPRDEVPMSQPPYQGEPAPGEERPPAPQNDPNLPPPPPGGGEKRTIFGMPVPQPPPPQQDDATAEPDSGLVFVDDDENNKQ